MFNKKLMLVVGGAVVASVAAFAVIAGTIVAQRGESDGSGSAAVIERDVNPLRAAAGAIGERQERVDRSPGSGDVSSKLARLVEAGEITQADADALTVWYAAKPEVTITGEKRVAAFWVYEASDEPEALAELVTEGIISQADSDALSAWATARPDVDIPGFGEGHRAGRGKEHGFWSADLGDSDYDFAEDLSMLVDKGVLTQADADALQSWLDSKPTIEFPEDYTFEDAHDYADADDGETDLASELAEKVAAGAISQSDADALLDWFNAMPEVSANFNAKAKAWLFDGEGDADHEGFGAMFDALAEFGMITDAQADEIRAWVDSMPDFSFNVGKIAKAMMAGEADSDAIEDFDVDGMLDDMVAKGVITQADSDALLVWWNGKPEIVGTLMDSFEEMAGEGRGEHGRRGSGHGARFSLGGASY